MKIFTKIINRLIGRKPEPVEPIAAALNKEINKLAIEIIQKEMLAIQNLNDMQSIKDKIQSSPPLAEQLGIEDEEMTAAEMAACFGEPPPPAPIEPDLSTKEKIEEYEQAMNNATDIYKTVGRIKNLARESGGGLTPQGEILCNQTAHLIKSFYDLADTLPDPFKTQVIETARKNENFAYLIINATKMTGRRT